MCEHSTIFFSGILPVPPFPSLLSKVHAPPNTDDIFLHPAIPGKNFMPPIPEQNVLPLFFPKSVPPKKTTTKGIPLK